MAPSLESRRVDVSKRESNASVIYISAGVCAPLIIIFAIMRFYAKLTVMKRKAWDDLTCVLGVFGGLLHIGLLVASVHGGFWGWHVWELTFDDFKIPNAILTLVCHTTYPPITWIVKVSLFILFMDIFGPVRWLRYMAIIGMIVTGLFYATTSIVFASWCIPRRHQSYFDAMNSHRCAQSFRVMIILGAVNVLSDFYLLFLPLPAVWSLNLPFRKKLAISAIFLTGFSACVASILGLVYRVELVRDLDITWVSVPVWATTVIEMTAGILVCCMPAAAALFRHQKPKISSFLSSYASRRQHEPDFEMARYAKPEEDISNSPPSYSSQLDNQVNVPPHAHTQRGSQISGRGNPIHKITPFDEWTSHYVELGDSRQSTPIHSTV